VSASALAGEPVVEPGSFRDPCGCVFTCEGTLYRQVNAAGRDDYECLMQSGLYRRLVDDELLVAHDEVDDSPAAVPRSTAPYKILRPKRVPFVSYPYEWCFSHLKDAALATLEIQRIALAHGMWLKDASAYNMQRVRGRQVLIDSLSLQRYREANPWKAYGQFCRHFLAPLALMSRTDCRLNQWARVAMDGIPLDLAARLLPWRSRLTFGLGLHILLHARMQRKYAAAPARGAQARQFSRRALERLVDSLESTVRRLTWRDRASSWSDYYRGMHNYEPAGLAEKARLVSRFLEEAGPRTVWDLGGNVGPFSRIASALGALTVCWDLDSACVEINYAETVRRRETRLLPLVLDLANPSPAIGWAHKERMSLAQRGPVDAVLALGLVHHLALANNVPLGRIAEFLSGLGRWLVVEFVPKADAQAARLMATRESSFPDYEPAAFERAFSEHFAILAKAPVTPTLRTMYLMQSRNLA
jgi:hypothetical protein